MKMTPDAPNNESGFIQLIRMGESIRYIWVKLPRTILSSYCICLEKDDA